MRGSVIPSSFCSCPLTPPQREREKARRSMANGEIVGDRSVLRRAWSRPHLGAEAARRAARARAPRPRAKAKR